MEKGRFEQFLQEAYLLLGGISRVLASCFQSESFCPRVWFPASGNRIAVALWKKLV